MKEEDKRLIESWKRKTTRSHTRLIILYLILYVVFIGFMIADIKNKTGLGEGSGLVGKLLMIILVTAILLISINHPINTIRKIKNGPSTYKHGKIKQKHTERMKRTKSNKQSYHFYVDVEFDDGTHIEGVRCNRLDHINHIEKGSSVIVGVFDDTVKLIL